MDDIDIEPAPLGPVEKTERGFEVVRFKDLYDTECSLQQSSLADDDAIWFGPREASPKILASRAALHGLTTSEMVRHLQHWLETGTFDLSDGSQRDKDDCPV